MSPKHPTEGSLCSAKAQLNWGSKHWSLDTGDWVLYIRTEHNVDPTREHNVMRHHMLLANGRVQAFRSMFEFAHYFTKV
jgi:hypothetical protein